MWHLCSLEEPLECALSSAPALPEPKPAEPAWQADFAAFAPELPTLAAEETQKLLKEVH